MDPPTKIDVSDSQALKKTVDDAVGDVLFSDAVGFQEYMGWSNRRLLLMTAAAAAGFAAQFAPIPLPQGRLILGALVTLFFILYGALQYLTMFVDKDYIIMTRKHKGLGLPPLKIRSKLAKYSDLYELALEDWDGKQLASMTKSVGEYFTQDGDFGGGYVKADVEALLKEAKSAAKQAEAIKKTATPESKKTR